MLRLRAAQREGLRDGLLYRQILRQLLEGEGEHQWQAQLQLKRDVLEDELLQVFPPLPSARRCLARAVVQELETLEEVEDDLFKLCTEEASKSTGLGLQGHKIFEIGQALVVLRVAEQIGGGLETGCVIWTGGCMLLGLCLSGAMNHLLTGHILELGAGCGLLGLSLALQGSQVTLSDAQPQVLDNLMYNVEATKRCKGQAHGLARCEDLRVEVAHLDWCEPKDLQVDVLIGSDLAYDAEALPALAALLSRLLRPRGTAWHAILASMQRQESTMEVLKTQLTLHGLRWHTPSLADDAWRLAERWARHGCDAEAGASFVLMVVEA